MDSKKSPNPTSAPSNRQGPFHGSCLCGAICYTANKLIGPYVNCHCPSCRKASGSAFAANISAPVDGFTITQGEELLRMFESSPKKFRHFCQLCGTPLFTKVGVDPSHVRIRLGSLDTEYTERASAHIFANQSAPWYAIEDSLPQYPDWPDRQEVPIPGSRQPSED